MFNLRSVIVHLVSIACASETMKYYSYKKLPKFKGEVEKIGQPTFYCIFMCIERIEAATVLHYLLCFIKLVA